MTTTQGIPVFEGYGVPRPSIAEAVRDIDAAVVEIEGLRYDARIARLEAANHRRCAEAERAESSRLRAQNLGLAKELAQVKKALLSRDQLMDAGRAVHIHAYRVEPQCFQHWLELRDHIEAAAMEAQP